MYVKTHVVPQAVRHEEPAVTLGCELGGVALHKAEFAETSEHVLHGSDMHAAVAHARLSQAEGQLIAFIDNLVDLPLACGVAAACRVGAGEVGGVVLVALHARIDHQQLAALKRQLVAVAMEDLAMLGEDGREAHAPAFCEGDALHRAHYRLLHRAELHAAAGCRVHLNAQIGGMVEKHDFLALLDKAKGHKGAHQRERGCRATLLSLTEMLLGLQTGQFGELECVVVPGGRHEMQFFAFYRSRQGR